MKIEIEESALDSLRAMVQQLQDERDMLLESCKELLTQYGNVRAAEGYPDGYSASMIRASAAIAACTETKQVLAGK